MIDRRGIMIMKRRICALALALCMAAALLTIPAGATISADSGEVQTIRALGILVGDTSGNLNLEGNVTRAQFAKMLVNASSYKDSVGDSAGVSLFKDVKSGYWASAYIKIAVDEGWMIGYTDGTFRPYQSITLEQACTTVLRLLGYDDSSMAGSFPAAQLSKASALGLRDQITLGQGGIMTRSDCVYLFYHALTAKNNSGQTYASTLGYTVTNGQVDYAAVVSANLSGPYVAAAGSLDLPFTPAAVYQDGSVSTLSAVSQYDVYYYNAGLRTMWVYTDRAGGTITALSPNTAAPTAVTLGGTTYTIGTATAAYKLSALGGFQVGDTALLLLGMNGEVVDVVSGSAVDTIYYGVVTASSKGTSASGDASVVTNVTVACTDGVAHTFAVSSGLSYTVGSLVSVSVNGDGTTISNLTSKAISGTVNAGATKIGSYTLASDVQILDTTSAGAWAKVYPSRLAGAAITTSAVRFYMLNASGEISRLILDDVTGDTWKYCYMVSALGNALTGSGSYTYIMNGKTNTVASTSGTYSVTSGGAAIRFAADGSVSSIRNTSSVVLSSLGTLTAVGGNKTYQLDDSVQVYLQKDGGYYQVALSSVDPTDYSLTGWYDSFGCAAGGRIRVIIATAK